MRLVVAGCTGMVGREMLKVLEERNLPIDELIPVASDKSAGKQITFGNKTYSIKTLEEALSLKPDAALFSAGAEVSREWVPRFARQSCYVIDNSSAWRADPEIPLVVPEINSHLIQKDKKIISNPNCSTIQLVVVLYPLHQKWGLKRVVVSTYQSVTGSGMKGYRQLMDERKGKEPEIVAYPHPIDLNLLPHGGSFLDNAYTTEEMKLVFESRKIMNIPGLKITSTVVRVPVIGGHSESVNIEFENDFELSEVYKILMQQNGIILQDDIKNNVYPMPLFTRGKDEVFVGRIRRDESVERGINLWIVADNLRKGAATNAVQILEEIMNKGWI